MKSKISNNKGLIAETYNELQAIPTLQMAKELVVTEKASFSSFTKTILQSLEIAFLNSIDLYSRIKVDIESNNLEEVRTKLNWILGFQKLILDLSLCNEKRSVLIKGDNHIKIKDSKSYNAFFKILVDFDKIFLFNFKEEQIKTYLEINSNGNLMQEIISKIKIINQNIISWEKKLGSFYILEKNVVYREFVAEELLLKAVNDTKLSGDTFFTQFRGLHQIPEILAAEINDNIDFVIDNLNKSNFEKVLYSLKVINLLTTPIVSSLDPLIDYLSIYDYHKIRENLGLTSGSHSTSLHTSLLNQKYRVLSDRVIDFVEKGIDSSDDNRRYIIMELIANVLELRIFINKWRDNHINLPRNNLGGNFTKSLIGSSDAIEAVKKMQLVFKEKDNLSKWLGIEDSNESLFTNYINDKKSLDDILLRCTGQVTKEKFKDVQNREGNFSPR